MEHQTQTGQSIEPVGERVALGFVLDAASMFAAMTLHNSMAYPLSVFRKKEVEGNESQSTGALASIAPRARGQPGRTPRTERTGPW